MLVVDLSRSIAGAFCGRLLALRGERVVHAGTFAAGSGSAWVSRYLRSGVETFDGDAAALRGLVQHADVVLTGWDAGQPQHDIDIRQLNRSAVEVVVSSFGADGPYAGFAGGPLLDWAAGGYLAITGLPTCEPLAGPDNLPAYVAGYVAASAVEVGLRLRQQGAHGPRLDVSTMEVMVSAHQTTLSMYAASGDVRGRHRHPQPLHPLDILECADGWVSVAVVTDEQYDAFAAILGDPTLLVDERFATGRSRHAHADEFDALVQDWFRARTVDEVVDLLQGQRVPAVKLTDPVTVQGDPQLRHRGYWHSWRDEATRGSMPGDPIRVTPAPPRTAAPAARPERALPLDGTLVVDLTEFWAGPMATRILGDLGATVVRVERPGSRFHAHPSGLFVDWKMHRGKYSLAVDLKAPEGRQVARDLAQRADVFIENFRPGVVGRFGLAYPDIAAANPSIVYVSLSGFGQDGPHASWASFGPMLEAASSLQARTKYGGGIPLQLGHSLPDAVGGFAGAFAALNRLRVREATGCGAYVDISQLETYAAICGEDILQASVEARWVPAPRRGSLFRCRGADAWVAVEAMTGEQLAALSAVLGCEPSTASLAARLAGRDKFEVASLARAHGVPAFAVLDAADLAHDPHLYERGYLVDIKLDGIAARMPSLPLRGHPGTARIALQSPAAGQHSEYVLQEILGYPRQRIDQLLASQAVVTPLDATLEGMRSA